MLFKVNKNVHRFDHKLLSGYQRNGNSSMGNKISFSFLDVILKSEI